MKTKQENKKCKNIRGWLFKVISDHVGFNTDWIESHIANCPKCQRRMSLTGKVNLALSVIKSEPHNLDLLMRANARAIGVLKHSLRNCAKAQKLKRILPEPKLLEKCKKYKSSIANTAACLAILFLMKTGIFSSMDKVQSDGQKAAKQYYAKHVGDELANEIFSA